VLKTFCFSLLRADTLANFWIFFTIDSHELITLKILVFYLAHFDFLVTDGVKLPKNSPSGNCGQKCVGCFAGSAIFLHFRNRGVYVSVVL
jgi:hypothetical protein